MPAQKRRDRGLGLRRGGVPSEHTVGSAADSSWLERVFLVDAPVV